MAGIVFIICIPNKSFGITLKERSLTNEQKTTMQVIARILETQHLGARRISPKLGSEFYSNYLDSLDNQRSYFVFSDVASFSVHRNRFHDYFLEGDIEFPLTMMEKLLQYQLDEVEWSLAYLEEAREMQDGSELFDFTKDEEMILDRGEEDWPWNEEARAEIWRKDLKRIVLGQILAKIEREEILNNIEESLVLRKERILEFKFSTFFETLVNALLTSFDPHTRYFAPAAAESFNISLSNTLVGIGAELIEDGNYTVVQSVVKGGPADLQGDLKREDKIIGVGQEDEEIVQVYGWRIRDVVTLIRGEIDSIVTLQVISQGQTEPKFIRIKRNKIEIERASVYDKVMVLDGGSPDEKRVGIISIPSFYADTQAKFSNDSDYKSTTRDVRESLKNLSKVPRFKRNWSSI